jgi:hypothetical protein
VTSEQVIPLLGTVLCRYLYASYAAQRQYLSSKDKTLLFRSGFNKLTGISHSIIIMAFPLGLSKKMGRKELVTGGSLWQTNVLIPPCQKRTIILLIQPSSLLKDNKKKCFGGGLGTIWISKRTRDKAPKEKPL